MRGDYITDKKVAIVCDWIKDRGGAELVLTHLLEIFPEADIFTSVFFADEREVFKGRSIETSFIQKIPILNKSHKLALTLRPLAFESFDLSNYDIVISSSSAESKGVITKPECLQICYCHTPTRYFWSHFHEYLNMMEFGILNPLAKSLMPRLVHKLRKWDYLAAQRPDYFIANSANTASRIKKYYNRDASVIYPSIDTSEFSNNETKGDFYLAVGRCIPYKKFDLLVAAFNQNGKKIILVTNTENKLYAELVEKSNSNIEWKLNITKSQRNELYAKAKAFIFPPEEDFGLVQVEAMASGTPVIAYGKGGATETVIDGVTGKYFYEQTVDSLNHAIDDFERLELDREDIINQAKKFDVKNFKKQIIDFINTHDT